MKTFRIHGDNIVECVRALEMIRDALEAQSVNWLDSPLHAPLYRLVSLDETEYHFQILPGYGSRGRWGADLTAALRDHGAPLAEAADAVITEFEKPNSSDDHGLERLVLAIEFCGALPAGNNAWQRCGRSYSYAISGVPYLYVSELGGYELSADRTLKAARFPNPLVPFAFVSQAQLSRTFALPVYVASPTIDTANLEAFESVFGWQEALQLVKGCLDGVDTPDAVAALVEKGLRTSEIISAEKKREGGLTGDFWRKLLANVGINRLRYLQDLHVPWRKKLASKMTKTDSFEALRKAILTYSVGAGASDMPFGLIPQNRRTAFGAELLFIYESAHVVEPGFSEWICESAEPLIVVFVAGFKPHGEDSRPDRGLLPLVRMIFGEEVSVLSIVYGPGTPAMWASYKSNPSKLERSNGLWQSVLRLSDAVLIDNPNSAGPNARLTTRVPHKIADEFAVRMPAAQLTPKFSEHDVDTVIKMIAASEDRSIFEGLCNPPGGDWSGISLMDAEDNTEYRWTSLPRVSGIDGKRPDHVLQFVNGTSRSLTLSVESKERLRDFEPNIGPRLVKYLRALTYAPATISRIRPDPNWGHSANNSVIEMDIISAGAFIYPGSLAEVIEGLHSNKLNAVFAVSFDDPTCAVVTIVHDIMSKPAVDALTSSALRLGDRVVIEVHGLENVVE